MAYSVYGESTIGCRLRLTLEKQPEGGWTITCKELPELITECDSLDKVEEIVADALYAIIELYEHQQRSLPEEIQILDNNMNVDATDRHLLETVVPIHEVSRNRQKVEGAWV